MSEFDNLRALALSDRGIKLQEHAEDDVQRLWQVYEILGYTDEEIRHAFRDLAKNEYLRRRANVVTDEHIREANRQRRITRES